MSNKLLKKSLEKDSWPAALRTRKDKSTHGLFSSASWTIISFISLPASSITSIVQKHSRPGKEFRRDFPGSWSSQSNYFGLTNVTVPVRHASENNDLALFPGPGENRTHKLKPLRVRISQGIIQDKRSTSIF